MPTIKDFIDTAEREYNVGAENHRYHLGELEPKLLETADVMDFYLL